MFDGVLGGGMFGRIGIAIVVGIFGQHCGMRVQGGELAGGVDHGVVGAVDVELYAVGKPVAVAVA